MVLIQNFYKDSDTVRNNELEGAIESNIKNPLIKKVVFIISDKDIKYCHFLDIPKVMGFRASKDRVTYTELFHCANKFKGIKIIANLDIYFDETLQIVKDNLKEKEVYALSRYDKQQDGSIKLHNHRDSQDCWIFRDKVNINVSYGLGEPGCDNAIAWEFNNAGFKIFNPALSIKAIHYHSSNKKSYCDEKGLLLPNIKRVSQPYLRLDLVSL